MMIDKYEEQIAGFKAEIVKLNKVVEDSQAVFGGKEEKWQ